MHSMSIRKQNIIISTTITAMTVLHILGLVYIIAWLAVQFGIYCTSNITRAILFELHLKILNALMHSGSLGDNCTRLSRMHYAASHANRLFSSSLLSILQSGRSYNSKRSALLSQGMSFDITRLSLIGTYSFLWRYNE